MDTATRDALIREVQALSFDLNLAETRREELDDALTVAGRSTSIDVVQRRLARAAVYLSEATDYEDCSDSVADLIARLHRYG